MYEFKIGDRIRYQASSDDERYKEEVEGEVGTITRISPYSVKVRWDNPDIIGNTGPMKRNLVFLKAKEPFTDKELEEIFV